MNSFSFNRFGKMLRWVLSVNFRMLMAWTVGSFGAVFMLELIAYKLGSFDAPWSFLHSIEQMCGVMLIMGSLVMANAIVLTINEKRKRESFLMLPATNLEKFLALLVFTSVISVVCMVLAFVLGDSLRMLWFWISTPESLQQYSFFDGETLYYWWSSAVPLVAEFLTPNVLCYDSTVHYNTMFAVMQLAVIAGLVLWLHSLMILGGTLLRKYAFIITGAFILLCGTLFGNLMQYYEISMFQMHWENGEYVTQDVGTMAYVLAVVLPLLAIFNYWASFRVFKGFQLMTNKWMNYDFYK